MADLSALLAPTVLWIKLVASLVLAGALVTVDYRYALVTHADPVISVTAQTLGMVAAAPSEMFKWAYDRYRAADQLADENQHLRDELLRLQQQILSYQALEAENQRLRSLAELDPPKTMARSLGAEVLRINTDSFRQQIVINRGGTDGVYVGQPVLDAKGVVGQIFKVGPLQSTVLLVTDVDHAVLTSNARTGDYYLAYGNGHNLKLRYVPRYNDLKVGDILVTSGLDDTYPAQRLVGEVSQIVTLPGRDFLEAHVEAGADLDRNQIVLLVWNRVTDDAP